MRRILGKKELGKLRSRFHEIRRNYDKRGDSAVSVHRLNFGLVHNAPVTSLTAIVRMNSNNLNLDLEAELYIGAE